MLHYGDILPNELCLYIVSGICMIKVHPFMNTCMHVCEYIYMYMLGGAGLQQAKSELRHLSDQLHRERMEVERLEAELLKSGDLLNDLHQAYTSETELVHKLDTKLKEQREAYRQLQSELMAERDKRSALQTEILLLRVNGGGTPESPASPDGSKSGVDLLRDQVAILGREKLRLEYGMGLFVCWCFL